MLRLTRRQVLAGAVAAGVALLPGGGALLVRWSGAASAGDAPAFRLAARVEAMGADMQQLATLGTRYLRRRPNARPGDLIVGVAPSGVLPPALLDMGDEELRGALAERVRSDFRAGRTTPLGGWVLAEAEARLCAIIALTRA